MAISILGVFNSSVKFTLIKIVSALIGMGVTLYVANILSPEQYGVYGLLSLWLLYVSLIAPGIYSAASREIPVMLGRGQRNEALKIQNISISAELIYTVIPVVAVIGLSFLYSGVIRIGLFIVAACYVTSRLAGMWSSMNFVREKFNTVALGNLIIAIVSPIVLLVSVHWLSVYALLVSPLIAHIAVMVYYFTKGSIGFRFTLNKSEIIRLLKIGIVLQGLGVLYYAFRLADRTIIASMLPLGQLGLYTFATGILTNGLNIFADFGNVLQPILWREAGIAENLIKGFNETKRIAIYLALGTAVFIPLSQLGYGLLVSFITKQYIHSIPIYYVLSYNLYLNSIAMIPTLILSSSLVNKQKIPLYLYAIGLTLNIGLDILAVKLGYGIIGISWVTIATQGLVTFALYYFVKDYMFKSIKEYAKFIILITIPFLISLLFYPIHIYMRSAIPDIWLFVGISLCIQIIAWFVTVVVLYRGYLSVADLQYVIKKIRNMRGY